MEKEDNQVLLKFVIGPYQFCAPAVDVLAIIQPPAFTQVPLSLHYIPGLFDYQDEVGMGICMRRKLGLQPHLSMSDGHFLISKLQDGLAGFWIDEAVDLYDSNTFDRREVITWIGHDYHDAFLIEDNDVVLSTNFEILYRARASTRIIEQAMVRQEDVPEESEESLPQEIIAIATKTPANTENSKSNPATSGKTILEDNHDEHQTKAQPLPVAARVSGSDIITPGYLQASSADKPSKQTLRQSQNNKTRALLGKQPGNQLHQTGQSRLSTVSPAAGYRRSSAATAATTTRQNSSSSTPNKIAAKNKTHSQASRYVASADEIGHQVGRHTNFDNSLESNEVAYHHPRTEKQSYRYTSDIIDQRDLNNEWNKRILVGTLIASVIGLVLWLLPEGSDKQTPATKYVALAKNNADTYTGTDSDLRLNTTGITVTPVKEETMNELPSDSDTIDQDLVDADISVGTGADTGTGTGTGNLNILNADDLHISIEKPDGSLHNVIASENGLSLQAQANADISSTTSTSFTSSEILENDGANLSDQLPVVAYETFTHTVVKGDTLWDIAAHYLKNPFQYPLLAALSNIKDPHWIYPGDIVRISRKRKQ